MIALSGLVRGRLGCTEIPRCVQAAMNASDR